MASARFLDLTFAHAHTGAPLSDLKAKVYINVPECEILQLDGNSHRIELPAGPVAHLVVEVSKEGYVPVRMHWQEYSEPLIPAEYTFALEPGTTIGGVVIKKDTPSMAYVSADAAGGAIASWTGIRPQTSQVTLSGRRRHWTPSPLYFTCLAT